MSYSTVIPLFLFLLPLLVQALPLTEPRSSRQLPPSQQQNAALPQFAAFQPPQSPNSFGGGAAAASFSAQAFDPKLAAPQFEAPNPGLLQQQPQFVANNGPLIRTPDGQFVLASQPIGSAASFQSGHILLQQQFFTPAAQPQQSFGNNAPFIQPASAVSQQSQSELLFTPSTTQSTDSSNLNGIFSTNASSNSSPVPISFTTSTRPPPPVDKSVDLDGDGALSLNEVQYAAFVHHGLSSSVVENLFNEVDHNKDNFLSTLEFNDIRPLVLAKAENAALRYLQNVDLDHNGLLSLREGQAYILREYGISNRDVQRIWRLVVPSSSDEMDAVLFSKLRRRVRGMSIRLARQIMKGADRDQDGHIDLREAQLIAFEQEGIGPAEVVEMLASVDDNNDGQLNAPEFADFERIVRAKAVETSKKALKVVDADGSGSLTMDEAKKIAFDHYGFDEATLEPFFAQADENEDGQLDAVEFAGFRSVIRGRAVKNALGILPEMDEDGDGVISESEAEQRTRKDDDMSASETHGLFLIADQDRNNLLDKVELSDFVRLVRLTSIKFVADHFRDYDSNRDKLVTLDELERLVRDRYKLDAEVTRRFFDKVDVDRSGDLNAGEIVDFRREIRRFAQDRAMQAALEEQNQREMAEIERKLREEANLKEEKGINGNEETGKDLGGNDGDDNEEEEEVDEDTEEEMKLQNGEMEKKRKNKKRKDNKMDDEEVDNRTAKRITLKISSESTTSAPTMTGSMLSSIEESTSLAGLAGNETIVKNLNANGQDEETNGEEQAATKVLLINQEVVHNMNSKNGMNQSGNGNFNGDNGEMAIKMENRNLSAQKQQNMDQKSAEIQINNNNRISNFSSVTLIAEKNDIQASSTTTYSTIAAKEAESMTNITTKKMRKRRRKTTTIAPTTTTAANESYEDDEAPVELEKSQS